MKMKAKERLKFTRDSKGNGWDHFRFHSLLFTPIRGSKEPFGYILRRFYSGMIEPDNMRLRPVYGPT